MRIKKIKRKLTYILVIKTCYFSRYHEIFRVDFSFSVEFKMLLLGLGWGLELQLFLRVFGRRQLLLLLRRFPLLESPKINEEIFRIKKIELDPAPI
jgi:hypothetical protein